jgi:hypothetical protein
VAGRPAASGGRRRGHELPAHGYPEPGVDKLKQPPRSPTLDRALGHPDPLRQSAHSPVGQTSTRGTGKDHRDRQIDALTQKSHRRALVANRAGETQAMPIGFNQIARPAAGFAPIPIAVQPAPAPTAATRSGLSGKIFIDAQEERMELGVQQCRVAHWGVCFCLGGLKRQSTLPRGSANRDGRLPPIPSSNPVGYCQLPRRNRGKGHSEAQQAAFNDCVAAKRVSQPSQAPRDSREFRAERLKSAPRCDQQPSMAI